jgi:signal transduction histidine kinase
VNNSDWSWWVEDALRGYLSRRCKRAYAHDMRNGLQGLQAGLDALARAARPNKPSAVPLEQLTQFVQQAFTNHERGLERVLESVAAEDTTMSSVSLSEMLNDLARFLMTDAARHRVRIKLDLSNDVIAQAVPSTLRLIFLGLLTNGIDSLSGGGEIVVSAQTTAGRVQVDFVDSRTVDDPEAFVVKAIAEIVSHASWHIERKNIAEVGYRVRMELPPPPLTVTVE